MSKEFKIVIIVIITSIILLGAFLLAHNIRNIVNTQVDTGEGIYTEEPKEASFRAIVVTASASYIEVRPIEDEDIKMLSDRVSIGLGEDNDALYFEGAELLITYTGEVMDSYPTQIKVIKIQTEMDYKTKIEDLPEDYSLEAAIEDNCFVSIHGSKIYNKNELDRFLENVEKNMPDFIRCVSFTTEGDMIITDVNFEGSNSFRTCLDWTRDKYSGMEYRTYYYGRFAKLEINETEESIGIYLNNPIEGDLNEICVTGYYKNAEVND